MDRSLSFDFVGDIAHHNACHTASLDVGSFPARWSGLRVNHADHFDFSLPGPGALERFQEHGLIVRKTAALRIPID